MPPQQYGKEPVEGETGTYVVTGAKKPGDKASSTSEIHRSISKPLPKKDEERSEPEDE